MMPFSADGSLNTCVQDDDNQRMMSYYVDEEVNMCLIEAGMSFSDDESLVSSRDNSVDEQDDNKDDDDDDNDDDRLDKALDGDSDIEVLGAETGMLLSDDESVVLSRESSVDQQENDNDDSFDEASDIDLLGREHDMILVRNGESQVVEPTGKCRNRWRKKM
jgi:hypothetical protein